MTVRKLTGTKPITRTLGSASHLRAVEGQESLVGRVISNYKLMSVLGVGGAGTVYLAERADHQFSAKAAVKVIDRMASLDLGLRFRVERQILASLNHPNIARLLDAGETDDGQPYLVMEHVEGETLERYCDEKRLDLRARLSLFLDICAAVQYAHQNLIIHRDIKPANILVTEAGVPKLLDFGIAKMLHARDMGRTAELTRMTDRVLTPEYASPEQITGAAVTTASDIYSLGVVLYRLLCGLRPYHLPESANQLELERSICVVDAPRPSAAVQRSMQTPAILGDATIAELAALRQLSAERLRRELAGDLDAIVMRAMRKEPEHRYSSVERLVADIRHYLANEPVQASQGNWLYLTQRFVRRHTLGVAAGVGFLVFLVGVAIVMSIQRQNIAAALEQATQDRERAEDVSQFMMNVFTAADPFVNFGREPTARVLLDQAALNIQNDLDQQPDVRARLLETIGRSYRRMGQPDRAAVHLREALAIMRTSRAKDVEVASVLTELAVALREVGRIQESDTYFSQAQRLQTRAGATESVAYAEFLIDLSRLENMRGDTHQALERAKEALKLMRALKGSEHPEVGAILADMANMMLWADDFEGAEQAAREAVRVYQAAPENHPDRIMADHTLAEIQFHRGNIEEAGKLFERALAAQRMLYGSSNAKVADTLASLAQVRIAQKDLKQAENFVDEALRIHQSFGSTAYLEIGYLQTMLATIWMRGARFAEAERILRDTVQLLVSQGAAEHQYVASAEHYLGEALLKQRKLEEAQAALTSSMQRWRRAGASEWRSARSANALGEVLEKLGRTAEAEQHLVESYRILVNEPAADPDSKQVARERITRFYTERGQRAKLDALLEEASQPPTPAQVAQASGAAK